MQLVVMNRLKNNEATRSAKSLGDSIKKHIFHKSLMPRTPKRAPPALHAMGGNEVSAVWTLCLLHWHVVNQYDSFKFMNVLVTNRMFLYLCADA